jgi:hypothetical protein
MTAEVQYKLRYTRCDKLTCAIIELFESCGEYSIMLLFTTTLHSAMNIEGIKFFAYGDLG